MIIHTADQLSGLCTALADVRYKQAKAMAQLDAAEGLKALQIAKSVAHRGLGFGDPHNLELVMKIQSNRPGRLSLAHLRDHCNDERVGVNAYRLRGMLGLGLQFPLRLQ